MNSDFLLNEEMYPNSHSVKKEEIEEFISKIDLFKDIPPQSLQLIDRRIRKLHFKKGETVISEFDEAKGVFFVHSGIVKLTKQDEHGNELIVCIKKKGDIFAEACLFNEGKNYPATGTMVKEGQVYFLNTEDLEKELLLSPELAIEVIRYMSGALRELTTMMRDIALLDVYTKTIRQIQRLAEQFGVNQCNKVHIEIPMTVQEFSTLIGTSRESVSRVFSKLKKDGIIDIKSKKIIINDWCLFCHSYVRKIG